VNQGVQILGQAGGLWGAGGIPETSSRWRDHLFVTFDGKDLVTPRLQRANKCSSHKTSTSSYGNSHGEQGIMIAMSFRFSIELPVRWKDIDAVGILNNAVYLTMVEQARYDYFDHLGMLEGTADFNFVLGEVTARYLAPGKAGMVLTIGMRTSRLGNKSFEQEYEVACGDLQLARVTARMVWVDADLSSCVIPDAIRSQLAEFEGIPERA
jgi:acyl-CoA thioester hydrolase